MPGVVRITADEARRILAGQPIGSPRRPTRRKRQLIEQGTKCRKCGCTQAKGCWPACWWVDTDLCSRCAPTGD